MNTRTADQERTQMQTTQQLRTFRFNLVGCILYTRTHKILFSTTTATYSYI